MLTALLALAAADTIVVTGRAQSASTIAQSIRATRAAPIEDQVGRWHTPVCITVVGVPPAIAARVAARVTDAAREAGMAIAAPPCPANVTVVFTADGRDLLHRLERRRPNLLASLSTVEARALDVSIAPVRWWYSYDVTGPDRRPLIGETAVFGANASSTDYIATGGARIASSYSSTLIGTNLNVDIGSATAIVDVTQASGKSLDAVADFVARVVLSPTRFPPHMSERDTILNLFLSNGTAPQGLTRFDRAYLWAVRRLADERLASSQFGQLAALIASRLEDPDVSAVK